MTTLDDAQKQGIVIGLKGVTNESRDRLDVDELLLKYPKTFNLFLLALVELQDEAKSNNDKMGWFQIAGIHGLPLKDWDGVPSDKGGKGSYCPHGTILFPTWHRPYLAMMEQSIYHRMLSIANQFQQPSTWVEAVKNFRLPFWDYLRPRGGNTRFPGVKDPKWGTTGYGWDFSIPYILETEDVMVYKPYDEKNPQIKETDLQQIKNPLFAFDFPKKNGISNTEYNDIKFTASRKNTVRQDKERNNNFRLNTVLAQRRESEVETLLNFLYLPYYKDYTIFSNRADVDDEPTVYGSVESLHDHYHGNCGGDGGHMSRVPVAAFDPVFWLHHCNIDRIVAIWQAINPESWFPHQPIPGKPTEKTSLLPFRCTQDVNSKGFWSSNDARKVDNFGYNYAEIGQAKSRDDLQQRVMGKYLWSSQAYIRKYGKSPMPDEMKPLDLKSCPVFMYTTGTLDSRLSREIQVIQKQELSKTVVAPTAPIEHKLLAVSEISDSQTTLNIAALKAPEISLTPIVVKDPAEIDHDLTRGPPNETDHQLLSSKPQGTDVLRQWYIDTTVEKAAFDGAFTIFYFVGDFPADPEHYATAPTVAGTNHVFAAPSAACDNCGYQAEQGLLVSDTTAISPILLDYVTNGTLNSLHPSDVIPFLKTNLHWRAKGIGKAQPTPSAEVPGLQVAVSSSIAYLYAEHPVPEFIGVQGYPEVTAGRAGGLAQ